MCNRVVSDLPDTASSGSYLGDLTLPEPGLIRAVCWVTFCNVYLICSQGSGQSIWNVCNYLCIQTAASCVHGETSSGSEVVVVLIKPCHIY